MASFLRPFAARIISNLQSEKWKLNCPVSWKFWVQWQLGGITKLDLGPLADMQQSQSADSRCGDGKYCVYRMCQVKGWEMSLTSTPLGLGVRRVVFFFFFFSERGIWRLGLIMVTFLWHFLIVVSGVRMSLAGRCMAPGSVSSSCPGETT